MDSRLTALTDCRSTECAIIPARHRSICSVRQPAHRGPCGTCHRIPDDPETAKLMVEESLKYLNQWKSPEASFWIAVTEKLQGIIYSVLGDQDKACQLLEKALEAFEHNKYNLKQKIIIKNALGLVYARKGDIDKGLETIRASKALAEENGLQEALAHNYFEHGRIEMLRDNYEEAAILLHDSYEIYIQLGRIFFAKLVKKSWDRCERILRSKV